MMVVVMTVTVVMVMMVMPCVVLVRDVAVLLVALLARKLHNVFTVAEHGIRDHHVHDRI